MPREEWAQFWAAFGHAVRNAVDHGLETPDLRLEAGKAENGTICFAAEQRNREIVVSLADDGRGIDWDKIAARARDAGLPAERHEDLVAAVFADGLSTQDTASDVSGRGVGLGALKETCEHIGGHVRIESTPGKGTVLSFHMPLSAGRAKSLRPSATQRPQAADEVHA